MSEAFMAIICDGHNGSYSLKRQLDELFRGNSHSYIVSGWMFDVLLHIWFENDVEISRARETVSRLANVRSCYVMPIHPLPEQPEQNVLKLERRRTRAKKPEKISVYSS